MAHRRGRRSSSTAGPLVNAKEQESVPPSARDLMRNRTQRSIDRTVVFKTGFHHLYFDGALLVGAGEPAAGFRQSRITVCAGGLPLQGTPEARGSTPPEFYIIGQLNGPLL